jgi:hypothetical protein
MSDLGRAVAQVTSQPSEGASRDIFFEVGSLIGRIRPNNGANFQIRVTTILQWAVQCVSEVNVRLLEHA